MGMLTDYRDKALGVGMTWEQKLEAIQGISDVGVLNAKVLMRKPGDWYVSINVSIGVAGQFSSSVCGDGATPEQAVHDLWSRLTNVPRNQFVITNKDEQVRWNGFMWESHRKAGAA